MKSMLRRLVIASVTCSLSYCITHVPPGGTTPEIMEVDGCGAVRAHIRNHPGDVPGPLAASECLS